MYEGFKGGPRAQSTSEMRENRENCLYRLDKIQSPKFAVCSNANDLSKDTFRAISSGEEISAQFNRCDNTQEILEGGKWKQDTPIEDAASIDVSLKYLCTELCFNLVIVVDDMVIETQSFFSESFL